MSLPITQPSVSLELDLVGECLYWGPRQIALTPKAFAVLRYLVSRPDELATTEAILAAVWPDVVVEEGQVKQFIAELRKIFHDDPKAPRIIETVRGRGYRYIGNIRLREHAVRPTRSPAPFTVPAAVAEHADVALIGRERALAALGQLVAAHALVTVTGAGGVGKTLLARHLQRDRAPLHADRAALVELSPISDPALVVGAVAAALGVRLDGPEPLAALSSALRTRDLLLVLDNAEHLVDEVARLVRSLLDQARRLRIVVTSQLPLRLPGEQVFRLDALDVPKPTLPLNEAQRYGAVALFASRARAVHRPFELDAGNLPMVVEICRQLDGVPLAIELAAARVPSLGLTQLAAALGERLQVLSAGQRGAPARQQNLRAALDWTCGLLAPEEQAVFRRLGVFAGTFSLESAAQVAAAAPDARGEWAVANALSALVDCSLVGLDQAEPPGYRLLLSTRLFARELLDAAGETRAVRLRQLAHCTALVERASRGASDALDDNGSWAAGRARIAAEYSNIRGALEWAFGPAGGDTVAGAALAVALLPYWQHQHEGAEGNRWLQLSMAQNGAVVGRTEPAAGPHPVPGDSRATESTVALLIQRLQVEGIVGEAQLAGVEQAALMALARRLRPDDVRDLDAAVRELQRAVGIATQVVAQRGDAPGGDEPAAPEAGPRQLVGPALARIAEHTRRGELDHAVDAIDSALLALADHRANALSLITDAERTLLEAGVQQELMRRDAFAAARRVEAIAALGVDASGARPAWTAAYRAQERNFIDEGVRHGINLSLEVGMELARRRLASAADSGERCDAERTLAGALAELGDRQTGADTLREAIAIYRSALSHAPRERSPATWATLQNDLGAALRLLGTRTGDAEALEAAAAACREALRERRRSDAPLEWAETQHVLGMTLRNLGADAESSSTLEAAVHALTEALKERTPARAPRGHVKTLTGLGVAYSLLGRREPGVARRRQAVQAYRAALAVARRDTGPLEWAALQNNLGIELATLGDIQRDATLLREAVAAYQECLKEYTRERVAPYWASCHHNLGGALRLLGEMEDSQALLREAVVAFNAALQAHTRERTPNHWAATKNDLGLTLVGLGRRERDSALLEEAVRVLRQALEERPRDRAPLAWSTTLSDLGSALFALGDVRGSVATVREALAAWAEARGVLSPDSLPGADAEMKPWIDEAQRWLQARGQPAE